jgi:hypothetical protein
MVLNQQRKEVSRSHRLQQHQDQQRKETSRSHHLQQHQEKENRGRRRKLALTKIIIFFTLQRIVKIEKTRGITRRYTISKSV